MAVKGSREILAAIEADDSDAILLLLEQGVDATVVFAGYHDTTPLHWMAATGNLEVMRKLLECGAHIDARDSRGESPLHYASHYGQEKAVELLVSRGADMAAKNNEGWTPLHCAAGKEHKSIAGTLISKGAPVNARSKNGKTPLHLAACNYEMALLLISYGARVNVFDDNVMTPAEIADSMGLGEMVKLFLSHGEERDIFMLARNGELGHVSGLLRDTPELVDSRDNWGRTLLHWSVLWGNGKLFELLCSMSAEISASDDDGLSALAIAIRSGQFGIAETLIRKGADVSLKDSDEKTLLHSLALHKDAPCRLVEELIQKGVIITAKDRFGHDALFYAQLFGNSSMVSLLEKNLQKRL